jgi:hypothetical protein
VRSRKPALSLSPLHHTPRGGRATPSAPSLLLEARRSGYFWPAWIQPWNTFGLTEPLMVSASPRHDVTPWTKINRALLCQATLSIGPYLLREGSVPTMFLYPRPLEDKPHGKEPTPFLPQRLCEYRGHPGNGVGLFCLL